MKISATIVFAATMITASHAHAAEPLKTTAPVAPLAAPAPIPPAPPPAPIVTKPTIAAPTVTKAVVVKPAPVAAVKVNAVAKPAAPKAPEVATPQASLAPDEATVRQLNKKHLIDFVRAANAGDVTTFYNAQPQFAKSISRAQFVNKFGKYNNELPKGDLAALEANDFADTQVAVISDNKRYKGCTLVEAKSSVKLQVVQDSHLYKLTNRYCQTASDYKLVSFKLGYEE